MIENYQSYIKKVIRIKHWYIANEDIEDLVQDVNLMVILHKDKFDANKADFATWLSWEIRTAVSRHIEHKRAKCRSGQTKSLDFEIPIASGPVDELIRIETENTVLGIYDNLVDRDKTIVYNKLMEDCKYKDIADMVGVSVQRCHQRYKLFEDKVRSNILW